MSTTINGTGITFPNGTTQTTAATASGTVTSVATGNGLQGGTITTSGTLSVACPTFNTVGSYALIGNMAFAETTWGGNVAGSQCYVFSSKANNATTLAGTWKFLGGADTGGTINALPALVCRVS